MIGLLFTFVYLGVNGVHPDFFAQGAQKDPSIYLYFSFITMTTVGFGDFTPACGCRGCWSCSRRCSGRSSWSPRSPAL